MYMENRARSVSIVKKMCERSNEQIFKIKSLVALLAHSHLALCAQDARKNALRARDSVVVALRAPIYLDFALSITRFIALSILI